MRRTSIRCSSAPASAWCSRSPIRSPSRSSRTWPMVPRIHGLAASKTDLEEIVVNSLTRAGLFEEVKDRLNESGTGLSGGQQQRLCIARAISVNPEVILMDEPCSALDPIATARIETLMDELKENYCIVIVTHSMQQAARVSQRTAFFHLGKLVEVGDTAKIFTNPKPTAARRTTSPAASARMPALQETSNDGTAARAYRQVLRGGALRSSTTRSPRWAASPSRCSANPSTRSERRDPDLAAATIKQDEAIDALERGDRGAGDRHDRAPPAHGLRPPPDHGRAPHLHRSRAHRRSRQEHRQARGRRGRRAAAEAADARPEAYGRACARPAEGGARCLYRARRRPRAEGLVQGRGDRRDVQLAVPRAPHLHDGGPAQYRALHPSPVRRQEHRAHRRSRHQHRRDGLFPGAWHGPSPISAPRATPRARRRSR